MKNIIELKNITFKYEEQTVFKNINLNINKGDFFAFVGPNGSGKSTLMRVMIGDLLPDKGEIKLFGENINLFKEWSQIGYMSQDVRDFNQSFPATVKEIIAANLYHQMGVIKVLNTEDFDYSSCLGDTTNSRVIPEHFHYTEKKGI